MTTTRLGAASENDQKQSIFVDGVLFDLDLGWWKGYIQLEAEDLDKDENDIPDVYKLGKKRILNHEAFAKFQLIEGRARQMVDRLSYQFMLSTVRFVPFTTLPEIVEQLSELRVAFNNFVEVFVFEYDDNKRAFMNRYSEKLGLKAETLATKYPHTLEIRGRFFFTWKFFEMSMPTEIRAEVLDVTERERLQDAWDISQVKVQEELSKWVDTVGRAMRKEIGLVCKNMKDTLDKGNTIREGTLDRTRETIKRLRSMNFIEDGQVNEMLLELERSMPGSIDREVPEFIIPFKGTLESIMAEAGDMSDVSEFTGTYKRKLRL